MYHSWYDSRTLHFDEWLHLTELGRSPSALTWVLAPYQEHFTPLSKLVYLLNLWMFGYEAGYFTLVNTILYITLFVTIVRLLHQLSYSLWSIAAVAILLNWNAVFPEAIIWEHQKMHLFLIGLVNAVTSYLRSRDQGDWRGHLETTGFLLLSMLSFGFGVFTIVPFIVFVLLKEGALLVSGKAWKPVVLASLCFAALFLAFAYSGVNEDYSARTSAETHSTAYLLKTVKISVMAFWYGIVLPFLGVFQTPSVEEFSSSWSIFIGISLSFLAGFCGLMVSRTKNNRDRFGLFPVLGFALALIGIFTFAQAFYRGGASYEGLKFLLDWNRYAFIPGVGFVIVIGVCVEALFRMLPRKEVMVVALLVLTAPGLVFARSIVERTAHFQEFFFRNDAIRDVVRDYELVFHSEVIADFKTAPLPDIAWVNPLLVPGYPLYLSHFVRYHPRSRRVEPPRILTFEELEQLSPVEREKIFEAALTHPILGPLYARRSSAPSEK